MKLKEEMSYQERSRKENETIGRLEKHYKGSSYSGIGDYTAHPDVNNYLWKKHKSGHTDEDMENKVNKLDVSVNSRKTPEALTVWSKSKHDPRNLKNSDGIVHHPAYLSTTLKKDVLYGRLLNNRNVVKDENGVNHHHIYKIDVPKNHPGLYVPDSINVDKSVKEFVLPRGTNLKHIKTDTQPDTSNVYHFHHLQVV